VGGRAPQAPAGAPLPAFLAVFARVAPTRRAERLTTAASAPVAPVVPASGAGFAAL